MAISYFLSSVGVDTHLMSCCCVATVIARLMCQTRVREQQQQTAAECFCWFLKAGNTNSNFKTTATLSMS